MPSENREGYEPEWKDLCRHHPAWESCPWCSVCKHGKTKRLCPGCSGRLTVVERVKIEVEVDVDVAHLAEQFAALTDDAQAQFLCFVAAKLGKAADMQAFHIGRHLRDCECSTEAAREFVTEIARAMQEPK